MKVTLINSTQNAKELLIFTKQTRLGVSAERLEAVMQMSDKEKNAELDYMVNTIKSSWEFMDFTFSIEGVSRAFTHQFVRNRTGSYAQQTMRIINVSGFDYVTGPSIKNDPSLNAHYEMFMSQVNDMYNQLIEMGAAIEDARGILPTNICTNIIAKFNLRTLSDMMASRASSRTQSEYRSVMDAMYNEAIAAHPWVAPFLRDGKAYALAKLESQIKSDYQGTTLCTDLLKLIDQVRNYK